MLKLRQAIVVEGRYDKNKLAQIVDAPIIETGGFGVMHNEELLQYLRKVAQIRGLIILTDPDGAGFVIRNYLKGALPKDKVYHAYVPDVQGKEKRKRVPGKEGKLGVEGMSPERILQALRNCGAELTEVPAEATERITKTDLYALGFTGKENSSRKRKQLLGQLQLPERLSTNALLDALNLLYTREEFLKIGQDYD